MRHQAIYQMLRLQSFFAHTTALHALSVTTTGVRL